MTIKVLVPGRDVRLRDDIFRRLELVGASGKTTADDGAANDRFGVSVAISDGIIVVGAPFDDNKRFCIRL